METEYDVIIVGGGPAGSSCATLLGRDGIKTLLVDKASFPRDKTCGDEISDKCADILRDIGVEEEIKNLQHSMIYGLVSSSPSGMTVETSEGSGFHQYVCKREIFDNVIFEQAKKKSEAMENFTVTDLIMDGFKVAGVKGVKKNGNEIELRAKIVVGADGATSIVARKLGLNNFDTKKSHVAIRAYYENVDMNSGRMEIHFLDECMPGYFWIFPVGNNTCNVGLGMLASEIQERRLNLKTLLERAIKNSRISYKFKNAKQISEIRGWNLPTGAQKRKRAGDGFILIGDAASLIDPLTGGGVGNAVVSAKIAADTIKKSMASGDFSYKILSEYEKNLDKRMEGEFKERYRIMKLLSDTNVVNSVFEAFEGKNYMVEQVFKNFVNTGGVKKPGIPLKFYFAVFLRLLPKYLGFDKNHTTIAPAATQAP